MVEVPAINRYGGSSKIVEVVEIVVVSSAAVGLSKSNSEVVNCSRSSRSNLQQWGRPHLIQVVNCSRSSGVSNLVVK